MLLSKPPDELNTDERHIYRFSGLKPKAKLAKKFMFKRS